MMKPKVSVIIPIYNTGIFLHKCIESVRNQTIQDLEIILVDDESPDNAPQMCDEYSRQDSRIIVIHKKNGGLGYARNSGLEVATGEYVSFIDSDDFIALDMMEKLYNVAKEYDADEVRSGTVFYNNGKRTYRHDVKQTMVYRGANEIKSFVFDLIGPLPEEKRDVKYMISVCVSLHKRCVIEEHHVRFTSERETLSEDLIFDLDLFPKMNCIVCIPDCFYHYRMNPNSLTHTFSMKKYYRTHTLLNLVRERLSYTYCYDEFILHFLRLNLLYLRNNINDCIQTREPFRKRLNNVSKIVHDELWTDLFNSYPYRKMNLKHRLYFQLLQSKMALPIMIVSKIVF